MIAWLLDAYSWVVLATVVMSWLQPPRDHPVVRAIEALTEPLLRPLRRMLPPVGGLDFSPVALLLGVQLLRRLLT